ncbi:MAG TPA: hypothetical protein VED19_01130 [Candidatus Nitrosopolaris sp.]|nr:hypothetical protein [Candidatus Nitrosopolaris sp.]
MKTEPLVMQRNMGAYVDFEIQDSPVSESNILESDVTTNIKFDCSCGQSIEVNSDAGGQRFNCPSCGRELTVPQIEKHESNQHASAASPHLFARCWNFGESLKGRWETIIWLFGATATLIGGICVIVALLT